MERAHFFPTKLRQAIDVTLVKQELNLGKPYVPNISVATLLLAGRFVVDDWELFMQGSFETFTRNLAANAVAKELDGMNKAMQQELEGVDTVLQADLLGIERALNNALREDPLLGMLRALLKQDGVDSMLVQQYQSQQDHIRAYYVQEKDHIRAYYVQKEGRIRAYYVQEKGRIRATGSQNRRSQ